MSGCLLLGGQWWTATNDERSFPKWKLNLNLTYLSPKIHRISDLLSRNPTVFGFKLHRKPRTLWLLSLCCLTPFTQYNRFDNWLYRVNKHPTSCQAGLTTGCMFVYTVQPVVKRVWQPCWTNKHCSFNRVVQPVWQLAVYTIQPFVKLLVKQVWEPVECLYTRYNWL